VMEPAGQTNQWPPGRWLLVFNSNFLNRVHGQPRPSCLPDLTDPSRAQKAGLPIHVALSTSLD
jgi:hypothetical protein